MCGSNGVQASGAAGYLYLKGTQEVLEDLINSLENGAEEVQSNLAKVSRDSDSSAPILPVCGIGVRRTSGPVTIEIEGDSAEDAVAYILGGVAEVSAFFLQMRSLASSGEGYWEMLRALDEHYDYISSSTRVDLEVCI